MSKRYVTTLTMAGWLAILAGAADAQSPSISFGDGQWTDLNAVCTAYHTLNGFTDNKWGGTAYMYIWASFDLPQTFSIQEYDYGWPNNQGHRATLTSEAFAKGAETLKTRLEQDGVASWEDHLVGEYIYRVQITAPDQGYHAAYQIRMTTKARSAFGRAVVDTPSESGRARIWAIVPDETPPVIRSVQVTALSSASATVAWETDEPASGFLFYGTVPGDYPVEVEDTPATTQHQVTLTDLMPGTTYYVIMDQHDAADNYTRSVEHTFTTKSGAVFVQDAYPFAIERTYDQRVEVPIQNDDVLPHRVHVSISSPYDDLILDFIGPGSEDRPLTLAPGEGRNILLAIHAQDATVGSYEVTLELRVDGAGEPVAFATAAIRVQLPAFDLAFEEAGTNRHTLGKTIRLTNRGGKLADFTVWPGSGLAGNVVFRPLVDHFSLAIERTIELDVIPILSADFTHLSGDIYAGTALDSIAIPLGFTLGEGDQIFQAHQNMKVWERVQTWYCTNRPQVQVRFQTPPPSTPTNLMEAYLEVNFSLPWNRNAYHNHDVHILVNSNEVGTLVNTIPHGKYIFRIDPSYIHHGSGALNTVKFNTRHLNGGHYVVSADVRLLFHIPNYAMYVIAESQEEAETFLRTYGIVGGSDLTISTDAMIFSEEHPDAGALVTIAAALDNLGMEDAVDVLVRFYDGPPQNEEQIGTDRVISSVPSQQRVPVETTWTVPPGNHMVYVVVDPEGTMDEIREDNNIAFRAISTTDADVESPTVLSTSPGAKAADVGLDTAIRITFSEPMQRPTAEGAFSIAPDGSGSLTWEDSVLVFTPDSERAELTTYTVTIDTSAEDRAGNRLIFDYRFAFTTADTTAPEVFGIEASEILPSSVLIGWDTDEPATSIVQYGTGSGVYTFEVADSAWATTHRMKLRDLALETTYYYTVLSTDRSGNQRRSAEYTFTTLAADITPPVITEVTASDLTDSSATLTWTTDEIGSSLVEYGTTTAYGWTAEGTDTVIRHRVNVTGLSASTTYHYRVGSMDVVGNGPAWSEDLTFKTQVPVYTITATAGTHGSISPSGAVTVHRGSDQTFTITPDTTYHVMEVKADGVSVGPRPGYTFSKVTSDHTIEATFARWNVAIRVQRATGGSKITAGKIGIRAGDPADVATTVTDEEGNPLDEPVTWSVEGEAGTVDENGHFIASTQAGDTGALIATAGGASDTVWVTILPNLLKRIEIIPASVELRPGERVTFKAQGYDVHGNTINVRPFWHVTRNIGTISSITGTLVAGDTPGSGDVVAFARAVFGDASTDVFASAKVVVRALPKAYALHPNVPNPFNPRTTIRYDLPMPGEVTLLMYDLNGRIVKKIVDAHREAGTYTATWDGTDEQGGPIASGIYVCRLQVQAGFGTEHRTTITRTRKVCLVR